MPQLSSVWPLIFDGYSRPRARTHVGRSSCTWTGFRLSGAVCGDAAAWAVIRHVTNACGLAGWVWEAEDTDLTGSRVYLHAQEAQVYRCARAAAAGARLLRVDDPVTVLVSEGTPAWRARSLCRLLGLGVSGRHSHAV